MWSDGYIMNGRSLISAILGGLLITAAGYADMVHTPGLDCAGEPVAAVCDSLHPLDANPLELFASPGAADLAIGPVPFLPKNSPDPEQANQSQVAQVLTEGTTSLNLCLSALMGLGLCGSVHWVKRLHFGFIPEWYHDGGPLQVGHSHAVNPNTLCTVPAYCFIQPDCTAEDPPPLYRLGTIILSLWRISQFTPDVIAPRAPPSAS